MKISKYFYAEEFFSKKDYKEITNNGYDPRWWLDKGLIKSLDWFKERCDGATIIINDWKWGGGYQYSGVRPFNTNIGAKRSQHKYGKAVDIKIKGYTVKEVATIIEDDFKFLNKEFGITTIEDIRLTKTWNHIDTRWTGLDKLFIVGV